VVLIPCSINGGYLPLAKGIVEGLIYLADREPEPCRGAAVDDKLSFEPVLLLIKIDVLQVRYFSQCGFYFSGPIRDLLDVVAPQNVLKLTPMRADGYFRPCRQPVSRD